MCKVAFWSQKTRQRSNTSNENDSWRQFPLRGLILCQLNGKVYWLYRTSPPKGRKGSRREAVSLKGLCQEQERLPGRTPPSSISAVPRALSCQQQAASLSLITEHSSSAGPGITQFSSWRCRDQSSTAGGHDTQRCPPGMSPQTRNPPDLWLLTRHCSAKGLTNTFFRLSRNCYWCWIPKDLRWALNSQELVWRLTNFTS